MNILEGLFYTKDHEWIKLEGDVAVLGITDYAADQLGDIVFVELPAVDEQFSAEDSLGAIESVKAASDVLIPVSGTILEVNEALDGDPALVNQDSYANWIVKFKPDNISDIDSLMDANAYREFLKEA